MPAPFAMPDPGDREPELWQRVLARERPAPPEGEPDPFVESIYDAIEWADEIIARAQADLDRGNYTTAALILNELREITL